MEGNHSPQFEVGWTAAARQQARDLLVRAKAVGYWEEISQALREVRNNLESDPIQWGDPLHQTKLPGGLVCRGSAPPLYVQFAVYEQQRAVVVYRVAIAPYHPLAST